ncbi:hypothetical protein V8F33_009315 [Rhypophila sp. PSN 637]
MEQLALSFLCPRSEYCMPVVVLLVLLVLLVHIFIFYSRHICERASQSSLNQLVKKGDVFLLPLSFSFGGEFIFFCTLLPHQPVYILMRDSASSQPSRAQCRFRVRLLLSKSAQTPRQDCYQITSST